MKTSNLFNIVSILLILTFYISVAALQSFPSFINWWADDAFFYLKIASNVINKGIISFDGENITNGFHPLWLILITPLFYIENITSLETMTRIIFVFQSLIIISSLIIFFNYISKKYTNFLAIISSLWLIMLSGFHSFGLEAHLTLFLTILTYIEFEKNLSCKFEIRNKLFALSGLITLLFLARLDAVILFIPISVYTLFILLTNYDFKKAFARAFILFFPVTVTFLMIISTNIIYFDNFSTISSYLKVNPSAFVNNVAINFETYTSKQMLFVFFIIFSTIMISIKNRLTNILLLCMGSLIFLLTHFLINAAVQQWYFVNIYFCFSIGLIILINEFVNKTNIKYFRQIVITIFMLVPILYSAKRAYTNIFTLSEFASPGYNLAKIINKFDKHGKYFLNDGSGIVSFFSDASIVNGDGLVNNFEYQEYLSSGNWVKYLKDQNIDYYVDFTWSGCQHCQDAFKNSSDYSPTPPKKWKFGYNSEVDNAYFWHEKVPLILLNTQRIFLNDYSAIFKLK